MIASVFARFCTRYPKFQGYREHFHHKLHSTGASSCRQTGASAPRHPRQQGFVRNRSSGVARLCPDKVGMPHGAVCTADWGSTPSGAGSCRQTATGAGIRGYGS